jgi:hypothetical protein
MELFLAGSAKLVGEEKAISVLEARDWVAPDTPRAMQQGRIKMKLWMEHSAPIDRYRFRAGRS